MLYVLGIGIEGLPFQKIWIRSKCLRMYDYCTTHHDETVGIGRIAPSLAITGQPGIGTPFFRLVNLRLT